ncbi:MAG: DUF4342 domain-containing protein [Chloroflexia bacterium]
MDSETNSTNGTNDTRPISGGTTTEENTTEEFRLSGGDVMARIKELVHNGNVRRIIVKNNKGKVVADFSLTAGVIGAVLMPSLAALGTLAALAGDMTIVVERKDA